MEAYRNRKLLLISLVAFILCSTTVFAQIPRGNYNYSYKIEVKNLTYCSREQMENYANNYLISIVGQEWFSKYYKFNGVFFYKPDLSMIQDPKMTSNSYLVEAHYSFIYPNFSEVAVSLVFKLYNDSTSDCQNMPLSYGFGIVKPFTISITPDKAVSIFHSYGYNVNSVSRCWDAYTEGTNITYFKPAYCAPIEYTTNCGPIIAWPIKINATCISKYGFVDVENGTFYTEPVAIPLSSKNQNVNPLLSLIVGGLVAAILVIIIFIAVMKKKHFKRGL